VKKLAIIIALAPLAVLAQAPIASSNFTGVENPLSENGAWVPMFSMSPDHTQFQKNNAAFMDRFDGTHGNHAVARTTAPVPNDQYSEIVVGHIGTQFSYVGVSVRIQTSGSALDSLYMYWGSLSGGSNNFLYQIVANGTSYGARSIVPHSAIQDGDRIRLVARGPVLYGIKNGVREFIFNTGPDPVRYDTGTTGMLAYVPDNPVTNATIASWSTGPAPASSGTWASSNFAGVEDPLDEGDRWFPLPGYQGFKKAGGFAVGKDGGHNISGVWSISPPARQYSEITLGTIASGAAGAVVRIDRNSPVPTGWLLFIYADNPSASGIYKIDPNANGGFAPIRTFTPDAILSGDKWRLTADGNTLQVSRNGVSQFTVTTDGSYPTGDVGIYTLTPAVTLMGWEGGDPGGPVKAPTISGFTPTTGPVGTSVTINGANLTGATAVAFNGVSATFSVTSDTAIQATVPTGATTGPVSVTTPGGTGRSTASFTVIPAPTITGFTPTSGPPGASVTISGSSFTGATAVAFNGVNATFTVSSDTSIQATVPASAATGPVSVTTSGGTATSSSSFTVLQPPTIAGFTPASGTSGTAVTITGTNLIGTTAVTFNGTNASFTVASDTSVQTSVPAGATTGPLAVRTSGGTAQSSGVFTVISPPAITSLSPASGPAGTTVTISGSSLNGATAVTFNGASASFTIVSDASIRAVVPAGATSGPVSVTTPGGTATSPGSFTVLRPPAIASFTPTTGPAGTAVTVSGTNLSGTTAVTFNGVSASFSVASDTSIQTAVPAGATTGSITVTTPDGTAQSSGVFTVIAPPVISTLSPANGPVGTTVTIGGSHLSGATAVTFNGVSASFTVTSDAAVVAVVPAGATSGPVSVTTPGGSATSANNFTVTAALTTRTAGNGQGTVSTSSDRPPLGNAYEVGTVVTLTATPSTGSNFTGWAGCDSVSGATCTVTMNTARTVTATFTLQTFPLTVSKANLLVGDGTVTSTSSPNSASQINCGSSCSATFNYGTVVTLTATPALLSTFNGWNGCDSTSGNTCTVAIRSARSVTANFLP
jgi:Divergent InlB B-repeat domain